MQARDAGRRDAPPLKPMLAMAAHELGAPRASDGQALLLAESQALVGGPPPLLRSLTPREREVIELRFGLRDGQPRTLDEVAKVYGITRERIRQIEARGLLKLRQPLRSQRLAGFADSDGE